VSLGSIIEIRTLTSGVDIEKLCFSKVVETNLYQGPLEICCII